MATKFSFSQLKYYLLFVGVFLMVHLKTNAQITVSSLGELVPYLDDDNVEVKLKPGVYSITAEDVAKGLYQKEVKLKNLSKVLLLFEGNNSTYDFTGVTINIDTKVLQAFGKYQVHELQIIGNNNVLKNLTMVDDGSVHDAPARRATNIVMDGKNNRIEGFHVTTKGSYPYGYGDAFGKGGKVVIPHRKHSACLIRGESNHLKDSKFIHRSYGHCIFMQAASNPLIEGCYVEGEVRKTDCTIKYMRTGVTVAHATGKKYVEGCKAIACENGFSLGSGEVVNCSADCVYGPVYSTTYERDKSYNADITILPASAPYYNGSGSVAYIGGSEHEITLKGGEEVVKEGLAIKVGGDKNSIRLMNGNFPHQNNFKASHFKLNNLTRYPVVLSDKSIEVEVNSEGKVIDLGTKNKVTQIKD